MAESSQELRVVITAIDQASAKFRAINQHISAMSAPLRQVGDRLGSLAEESGMRMLATRARGALGEIRNLTSGITSLAFSMTGLAAAGSVAGIFEMLKATSDFSTKLHFGALKTGMPTEQLAGWHYAAKQANTEIEALDKGMMRFNRLMADAAHGKAKDVAAIFRRFGHPITPGHIPAMADAMRYLNEAVTKLVAGGQFAEATRLLAATMGMRLLSRVDARRFALV
ncbi:MAG: hypothetical protein WA459_24765 [Stellaceae bacterium]